MNILDENGESYFVTAFDHSTQEQGTATSKDAFTGGDINASLTQEVVELREEVTGHGTDQLLYLAGKDGGLVSNDLVDIAVFQDPGIERITLACDTVVEGNDTLLEALYHCQIRMAVAQLQDIDGKAANVNDIGDGMSFQRAELGNGSRKRLGIAEYLADPDRVVLAVILKIHDLAPTQEVLLKTAVQLLIVCGRQTHKQGDVNGIECLGHLAALQLLGDGKEGEDIETLILRLIAKIGDALLCQRIVLVVPAEVRDNTYSNLLSLLTLCPTHQASLKERGLTRDEIDWLGYRTTPTTRLRRIVTELLERGCVLDGVPGFYCQKDTGQWTLDIRGSGIMLPDRNLNGQIEAIQVRLDKVYNQKFYNLTSIDQYYGTQSKCCPHYVGVHEGDEVVCLTEGVMKADIAYSFALGTSYESGFVGLTGVPSYSQFERALEELNSIGVVRINIMVDSDYQVKEEVRKARDRYIEMGVAAGFEVAPITWTQKRKGVDDLYKHLFRNK